MCRTLSVALAITSVIPFAGCGGGGSGGEGATVTGTVTLRDGKPLPGGRIDFVAASGVTVSGPIKADGKYETTARLAPGEYKVAVVNAHLQGTGGKGPPGLPPMPNENSGEKYVPIEFRYTKAETSGLKATVPAGATFTYDVPLK